MATRMRRLNDPVYGLMPISDVMHGLMHLPSVRYLKNRKQLGFVDDIYMAAENSRYPHVLGVSYVAGLMGEQTGMPEASVRLLQAAGILHDLHYPFSHPTDLALATNHEEIAPELLRSGERFGNVDGAELRNALSKLGINPLEVAIILEGKHELLSQFLSNSVLDADKFDYVPRDQRTANLTKTETMRIISELVLVDGKLGITADAESNVYDLLQARAVSFDRVYTHKRVHAAETMLRYAIGMEPRIQADLPRARDSIHRMNEGELLGYLSQSPSEFVRDLSTRLSGGYLAWYEQVFSLGGDSALDALRSVVARKKQLRAALLSEGFLCSTYMAEKAVSRNDGSLPFFPVVNGNGVSNLFSESRPALAAYQVVPRYSFTVYAAENSPRAQERAAAIVRDCLN